VFHVPIDGVLGLTAFRPSEVSEFIVDYIEAYRERGILRREDHSRKRHGSVRAMLSYRPEVASLRLPASVDGPGYFSSGELSRPGCLAKKGGLRYEQRIVQAAFVYRRKSRESLWINRF
jgi:hypothetical protein